MDDKDIVRYAVIGTVFEGKEEDLIRLGNFVAIKLGGGFLNDGNIREYVEKTIKKSYPKVVDIEIYKKI